MFSLKTSKAPAQPSGAVALKFEGQCVFPIERARAAATLSAAILAEFRADEVSTIDGTDRRNFLAKPTNSLRCMIKCKIQRRSSLISSMRPPIRGLDVERDSRNPLFLRHLSFDLRVP